MAGTTEWSRPAGVPPGWSLLVTAGLHSAITAVEDNLDVLVGAAVNGERYAVEGVLGWIRPLVVRYCRARVGGQEKTFASADDVAQEVCLAVLTALPSYRDQGRPFLAFVYGIAAHKVADAHRSAARNRAEPVSEVPDIQDLADGPEAQLMQVELAGRMAKLLDTLPDTQREIIHLRVVVGLSAEETAEAVNSTPGAVRVAQHRALSRLRSVLGAEGGGVR
jgi:RNA polymerase sigma-70 factor (ECF subfamily)